MDGRVAGREDLRSVLVPKTTVNASHAGRGGLHLTVLFLTGCTCRCVLPLSARCMVQENLGETCLACLLAERRFIAIMQVAYLRFTNSGSATPCAALAWPAPEGAQELGKCETLSELLNFNATLETSCGAWTFPSFLATTR